MSQHSANSIDLGREIPLCKDRVAFRIRQIFSCLAFLSSPSWQGDKKIPSEAAIEIQHALAHLALLTDSLSKNHQYKRLRQAISHLDRALIDFLKIFTLAKVKNNRKSITFLENWLGTRQKEYLEHTTSDQSPDSTISLETDLISIQTYSRLVGISFDTPTLDFKGEDLI